MRLDRRISIEVNTPSQDGAGQPIASWAELIECWAKVEHLGSRAAGGEVFMDNLEKEYQKVIFTIRYRSDITPKNRIVYRNVNYEIRAVREVERLQWLEIEAISYA